MTTAFFEQSAIGLQGFPSKEGAHPAVQHHQEKNDLLFFQRHQRMMRMYGNNWENEYEGGEQFTCSNGQHADVYGRLDAVHGIEQDSSRVTWLENIVHKLAGNDPKLQNVRVFVLERGVIPNALVMSDRTLVISSSLFHVLHSEDEFASVLAHELNHLSLDVFARNVFGVANVGYEWIHEFAADVLVKNRLENAGYNSLAFASAIRKLEQFIKDSQSYLLQNVSLRSRDFSHQTADMRATETVGQHFVLHSETSMKKTIGISEEFSEPLVPTQKEYVTWLLRNFKTDEAIEMMQTLHPSDLYDVIETIREKRWWAGTEKQKQEKKQCERVVVEYYRLLLSRTRGKMTNDERFYTVFFEKEVEKDSYDYGGSYVRGHVEELRMLYQMTGQDWAFYLNKMSDIFQPTNDYFQRRNEIYKTNQGKPDFLQIISSSRILLSRDQNARLSSQTVCELLQALFHLETQIPSEKSLEPTFTLNRVNDEIEMLFMNVFFPSRLEFSYFPDLHRKYIQETLDLLLTYPLVLQRMPWTSIRKNLSFYSNPFSSMVISWIDANGLDEPETSKKLFTDVAEEWSFTLLSDLQVAAEQKGGVLSVEQYEEIQKRTEYLFSSEMRFPPQMSTKQDLLSWINDHVRSVLAQMDTMIVRAPYNIEFIHHLPAKFQENFSFPIGYFSNPPYSSDSLRDYFQKYHTYPFSSAKNEEFIEELFSNLEVSSKYLQLAQKIFVIRALFSKNEDADEYRLILEETINSADIEWESMSSEFILYLLTNILDSTMRIYDVGLLSTNFTQFSFPQSKTVFGWYDRDQKDYSDFSNLRPIQVLLSRDNGISEEKQLHQFIFQIFGSGKVSPYSKKMSKKIFGSELMEILEYSDLMKNIEHAFDSTDNPALILNQIRILENAFPYSASGRIEFIIQRMYLHLLKISTDSLREKILFYTVKQDAIGYEGYVYLCDQIQHYDEYLFLRKHVGQAVDQKMNGSMKTSIVATADYFASHVIDHAYELVSSISTDDKIRLNTQNAARWFFMLVHTESVSNKLRLSNAYLRYNPETKKFVMAPIFENLFMSFADSIERLHLLGPIERFYILLRSFSEKGGILDLSKNEILHIFSSLFNLDQLGMTFLQNILRHTDRALLAFPLAQSLKEKLFQTYDASLVDYDYFVHAIEKKKGAPNEFDDVTLSLFKNIGTRESFKSILSSRTDNITEQKTMYKKISSTSNLFEATQRVGRVRRAILEKLSERYLQTEEKKHESQIRSLLDVLQMAGAGVVRMAQFSTLFWKFSPEDRKQWRDSMDKNRSMVKAQIWENAYNMCLAKDTDTPEMRESRVQLDTYLRSIEISDVITAGSIHSVWNAKKMDGTKLVLRFVNSNAEWITTETKHAIEVATQATEQQSKRKWKRELGIIKMLNQISYETVVRTIYDSNFLEDDTSYTHVVEQYRQENPQGTLYVPKIDFYSPLLKSEYHASQDFSGSTLNTRIQNGEDAIVADRLEEITSFMQYQLDFEKHKVVREGEECVIYHSDPHEGNFYVAEQTAILDRDLYLHLSKQDCELHQTLMTGTVGEQELKYMIEMIVQSNPHVSSTSLKSRIANRVLIRVGMEDFVQRIMKKPDQVSLLITLFQEITDLKLKIPVELIYIIRNSYVFQDMKKEIARIRASTETNV
ncbi:MAG: hypothetical protein UX04_C0003G0021 [Microgenomates group bacterium GW2011_GWF2_45_18]|nr:MAG: hypothetical protein UW18_C0002G0021 [Microgenomates group bacterium GW2011_GWF1_44_10]KKU01749.1 MAG: hypothetical protein UX04_C0003G0021 [Microgenomates group bacterium GW2011_GWF2_45_18]HAU98948.1 hypothetical protein [Candidatus Paceibacterota bacterium]HAX01095.1 hypothetical protein [Candidatus Paceibacterota bacterium]